METVLLLIVILMLIITLIILKAYRDSIFRLKESNVKKQEFYNVLCAWIKNYEYGACLNSYFVKHGYKRVLIYGMKEIGMLLYDDLLKNEDILMVQAIDKSFSGSYKNYNVCMPEDILPEADVLVVTAIHYYNEIEVYMENRVNCPIISIEDVVYGML